jgi:CheY-like chemotaxis protein
MSIRKKRKVLWIEDGARFDLPQLAAPVYMDGRFSLAVAENVADALTQLRKGVFDAIIVDIRLPPGEDPTWIELYQKAGRDRVAARLGLKLLENILEDKERLAWVTPLKIGVLTVEGYEELKQDLERLGVKVYAQKTSRVPDTILLDIIERVVKQQPDAGESQEPASL